MPKNEVFGQSEWIFTSVTVLKGRKEPGDQN